MEWLQTKKYHLEEILMRIYELTVHLGAEYRVKQAIGAALAKTILTTKESDGRLHIFCAAYHHFPEVMDSFGGVVSIEDLTDQLIHSRTQYILWSEPLQHSYFGI